VAPLSSSCGFPSARADGSSHHLPIYYTPFHCELQEKSHGLREIFVITPPIPAAESGIVPSQIAQNQHFCIVQIA